MLTNFFGKSKPINAIVLMGLFLVLFFLASFTERIHFQWLVAPLFLLVLGLVNFINSKNNLTFDNSFTFLFFVLLSCFFADTLKINTTFYANLTVLLFLRKVYSLKSPQHVFQKLFDAGFWLGISFIFEPFSVIFAILLYAAIILHQRIVVQTLLIPIIGFLIPIFLYFTYCFWYNDISNFNELFYWYTDYDFSLYNKVGYFFPLIFTGGCLAASIVLKTPKALSVKNTFRKKWLLVLLNFLLAIILVLLVKNKNGSELLYVIFPASVILANGLELFQKKQIADIPIILFLIGTIVLIVGR